MFMCTKDNALPTVTVGATLLRTPSVCSGSEGTTDSATFIMIVLLPHG